MQEKNILKFVKLDYWIVAYSLVWSEKHKNNFISVTSFVWGFRIRAMVYDQLRKKFL